jgi:two-component system sensor histidine kinase SenX3
MDSTVEISLLTIVGAGVVLGALLGIVFVLVRSRRHHARRLAAVGVRLEEAPVLDGKGAIDRLLGQLEEGIDRALLDRGEATTARDRLMQALQAVPHGVVICDDAGEVIWRNDQAERLARGRHADAVVDRTVRELLAETLAADDERRRSIDLFGPPRRVMELRALPLADGWRHTGAVAIVEDVSEQRRVEAMRRDFVANISHELKTPVGALALLGETIAAEDDPEVISRLAGRVHRESRRVARIIDDLLDLSRIEAEEAPSRERVAVHLLMAEAVERVKPLAHTRRISIEAPEPEPDLAVICDRRQVVSALHNLLENAIKYSERESSVEIRAGHDVEGSVALTVRDSGIGIPGRDLERIFERFYRVDRGRSRDTGGTGLGLAIVRHVVNNHDGEIVVESREGEGSTFTLRLPGAVTASISEPAWTATETSV